jgi:hypothetical protein
VRHAIEPENEIRNYLNANPVKFQTTRGNEISFSTFVFVLFSRVWNHAVSGSECRPKSGNKNWKQII